MVKNCFDEIWDSIGTFQGHEFQTNEGESFKYYINDLSEVALKGQSVDQSVDEHKFLKAYLYMNQYVVSEPDDIDSVASYRGEDKIQGSSYIWAILNDQRVLESCK